MASLEKKIPLLKEEMKLEICPFNQMWNNKIKIGCYNTFIKNNENNNDKCRSKPRYDILR